MGRPKIKKKELVIPFRETMAYRLLLVMMSAAAFIVAIYQVTVSLQAGDAARAAVWGGVALLAGVSAFFNLDRMKYARGPERTAKRFRRR